MKRLLLFLLTIVISMAFVTTVFAQATTEKPAGTTEKAPAAEKKAPAVKSQKSVTMKGEVVKNDGKEMTVKGPKGDENFDVSGVKDANKFKEGDKVTVTYKEKNGKLTASKIKKPFIKGKTEKKEVKEKAEKPAEPAK